MIEPEGQTWGDRLGSSTRCISTLRRALMEEVAGTILTGDPAHIEILPRSAPRWTGEPLNDATILIHAEQGFGDTIQFCRYVPFVAARSGQVMLIAPPQLHRLLGNLDGVHSILTGALPPRFFECR